MGETSSIEETNPAIPSIEIKSIVELLSESSNYPEMVVGSTEYTKIIPSTGCTYAPRKYRADFLIDAYKANQAMNFRWECHHFKLTYAITITSSDPTNLANKFSVQSIKEPAGKSHLQISLWNPLLEPLLPGRHLSNAPWPRGKSAACKHLHANIASSLTYLATLDRYSTAGLCILMTWV